MSIVRNGGIIGPLNAPTSSVASGVWDMARILSYVEEGTWPGPGFGISDISVLSLSGGGGGGGGDNNSNGAGGGGAGGILTASGVFAEAGGSLTVTVGAGGTGSIGGGGGAPAGNGTASSLQTLNVSSTGGGGGGMGPANSNGPTGSIGGSGGGGGSDGVGGSGISGQGFAGGNSSVSDSGAGGGGYSSVGTDASNNVSGNGGTGYDLSAFIGGSTSWVAGGGGGGTKNGTTGGQGGSGVGGTGSLNGSTPTNGAANTGSGGGGGASVKTGGNGSGGKVVIKYPGSAQALGGTISSATISGTPHTIHTFNSTSTFTPYNQIKLKDTVLYENVDTYVLPNTISSGDIVIVSEMADATVGGGTNPPAGFTLLNSFINNPGFTNYYKIADSLTAGSTVAVVSKRSLLQSIRVFVFTPPRTGATVNVVSVASTATLADMTIPLSTDGFNAPFIAFCCFGCRNPSGTPALSTTNYSFQPYYDITTDNAAHVRGIYVLQGGEVVSNTTASVTGMSTSRTFESSYYIYFS